MHIYKCDEKNNTANYIWEEVVETLGKSTEEGKKLAAKDFSEEEITKDKTTDDKADLQVAENKCHGEVGNIIYLLDIEERDVIHNMAMAKQGIIVLSPK